MSLKSSPDENPMLAELLAFNEARRRQLGDKPINPEGEWELMSEDEKRRAMGLEPEG